MPELIDRFSVIAKPYLDLFAPATCIEQSRILIEVLRDLDVQAEPVETILSVHGPELKLMYISGAAAEDRERGKSVVGEGHWTDHTTPESEGYGHVAVVARIAGEIFLVDPTLAQASMPERGMTIPRCVMALGPISEWPVPGCELTAGMDLEDGAHIEVTWIIKDTRRFESTMAWEPSHLWGLIHHIAREMKWAASVAERIAVRGKEGAA